MKVFFKICQKQVQPDIMKSNKKIHHRNINILKLKTVYICGGKALQLVYMIKMRQ